MMIYIGKGTLYKQNLLYDVLLLQCIRFISKNWSYTVALYEFFDNSVEIEAGQFFFLNFAPLFLHLSK